MHDDEVDVYYNVNNGMFYYIDPVTNQVMHTQSDMKDPMVSHFSVAMFLQECSPESGSDMFLKV